MCVCANEDITNSCLNELLSEAANYLRNIRLSEESSMTVISTNMEAQRAFLSAVTFERQKSWKKAEANYREVLHLLYKMKWRKHWNKEKLRLLLFECHFHCAVALQNLLNYQKAIRQFERAMEVVSWKKDECQAGCITGRVLHLHVPTLARICFCYIHSGHFHEALSNIDRAILLDFRNPGLFCVRSVVNFLLNREEKALSDVSFALRLAPTQVCAWLLRGLFKKLKKEKNEANVTRIKKLEPDLAKACEINPDAVLFIRIKDLRTHFQALFDRFLPSIRVSHSLTVSDVIETERTTKAGYGRTEWKQSIASYSGNQSAVSPKTVLLPPNPTFVCGVAKPQQKLRTCPPKDESGLTGSKLEQFTTESSISHHRYSLNISKDLTPKKTPYQTRSACRPRVPHVTLKEVVSVKSACVCGDRKFIGVRNFWERSAEDLGDNDDLSMKSERMYSRRWLQDRIPTKIPDFAGCRKLP